MISSSHFNEELDVEWIQLIIEARNIGMNLQDVRDFIKKQRDGLIQTNTNMPSE
ncbi:MAG TPA: anti-repressor SinI family protein [Niallia sp.]|nr:anti-repressor SinI family protein [Niallia sp.]